MPYDVAATVKDVEINRESSKGEEELQRRIVQRRPRKITVVTLSQKQPDKPYHWKVSKYLHSKHRMNNNADTQ